MLYKYEYQYYYSNNMKSSLMHLLNLFFSLNMNSMYLYVPFNKNQFHRVYEFNKWVIIILILSIIIIYKFYHF